MPWSQGYDIEAYDTSVLTGRTMAEIAGDHGSAEWNEQSPGSARKAESGVAGRHHCQARPEDKIGPHRRGHGENRGTEERKTKRARTKSSASAGSRELDQTSWSPSALKDLPGAAREAPACRHPAHAGHARRETLRRPGLVVRDQVGRLPRDCVPRERQSRGWFRAPKTTSPPDFLNCTTCPSSSRQKLPFLTARSWRSTQRAARPSA